MALQEKNTDCSLPEIFTSDNNQDEIDFSELEMESADSEKEMVVVSESSHQETQSSTRTTFTKIFGDFLALAARAISGKLNYMFIHSNMWVLGIVELES